ncbi:hypothetical protein DLH72_01500 [Candidatus Gracilibacteria bacterium]|nr:MAG: hypothetical protein DLH72_01500 [Candidatus Gracilibacteria bacterium]
MKEKVIKVFDYGVGTTMSGRNIGNIIKNDIKAYFDMGIIVNLNFDGVENVTHSFIDEVIGTYIQADFDKSVTNLKFTDCNETIKSVIKFVFMDRKSKVKEKLT